MVAKRQQYQAALDRAAAFGGARLIDWRSWDRTIYMVHSTSRPAVRHTVRVDRRGELRCTCEAGRQAAPCLHAAAVWLERVATGIQFKAAPRRESLATLPPAPRSETLGVRRPLPTEGEGPSAYDLLVAGGR